MTFHVTFETVLSAKCLLTAVAGAEEGSFACRNAEDVLVSPRGKLSLLTTQGGSAPELFKTEPTEQASLSVLKPSADEGSSGGGGRLTALPKGYVWFHGLRLSS